MRAKFDVDSSEASSLSGYLHGFADSVSNKRYIQSVMNDVAYELGYRFGIAMDAAAALDPESYQHVYESGDQYMDRGYIGNRNWRLWRLSITGSGGSRSVGFYFLPSSRPVPIHPKLLIPGGKKKRRVLPKVHVFVWKAPIMEYGISVTINPQLSPKKMLAFVNDNTGKLVFTREKVEATPGEFQNGRGGTVRKFTKFFNLWWNIEAPAIFAAELKPQIERELISERDIQRGVAHRARRSKRVGFSGNDSVEFNAAMARAKSDYEGKIHDYIADARKRRRDLYGD